MHCDVKVFRPAFIRVQNVRSPSNLNCYEIGFYCLWQYGQDRFFTVYCTMIYLKFKIFSEFSISIGFQCSIFDSSVLDFNFLISTLKGKS